MMPHRSSRYSLTRSLAAGFALASAGLAAAETYVSSGVPYHDGRPFFGIGYYDNHATVGAAKEEGVRQLGAAGFNTVLIRQDDETPKTLGRFFDVAEGAGVGVIPLADVGPLKWRHYHGRKFGYIADHPALLYANVADDCYRGNEETEHVAVAAEALHAIAPGVVTLASGNTSNFYYGDRGRYPGPFLPLVGVFETQAYTISKRSRDADDVRGAKGVYELMEVAVDQTEEQTPMIGIVQAFSYESTFPDRGTRLPTGPETDLGSWLAVMAGAKGVHYYTLRSEVYEDRSEEEEWILAEGSEEEQAIWDASVRFTREVLGSELAETFLWGIHDSERLGEELFAATWDHEGTLVVAIANSGGEPLEVSYPVKAAADAVLRPYVPRRPADLTLEGGAVVGEVGPQEVHIYRLAAAPRENLLGDAGFAGGPEAAGWTVEGDADAFRVDEGTGAATLETSGSVLVRRSVRGLPPGLYTLRADSSSTPGSASHLVLRVPGQEPRTVRASGVGRGDSVGVSIREVKILGGEAEVAYEAEDENGWSRVGNVELVRVGDAGGA